MGSLQCAFRWPAWLLLFIAQWVCAGAWARDAECFRLQWDAARALAQETTERLPEKTRAALCSNPIEVRFSRLSEIRCEDGAAGDRHEIYGATTRIGKPAIVLNSELLEAPRPGSGCTPEALHELALKTWIHEATHAHDLLSGQRELSEDPGFVNLLNFKDRVLPLAPPRSKNAAAQALPDPALLENPREALATLAEFHALDEELPCRLPAVSETLTRLLGESEASRKAACGFGHSLPFQLTSDSIESPLKLIQIDPARVYQIHYLLADRGDPFFSRFGHAMFRVVSCAPWRKTTGPECLKDLAFHTVVSYRALVTDVTIDSWKGITGKYPSLVYVLPLTQVVREYTHGEFRDLVSVPIDWSDSEKVRFLRHAAEQQWSYRGRYLFFSNNCGHESSALIRASADTGSQSEAIDAVFPKRILGALEKEGLARNAADSGLIFPSQATAVDQAFRLLVERGLQAGRAKDGVSYLETTLPEGRAAEFALMGAMPAAMTREVVAAFIWLEVVDQIRTQVAVKKALAQWAHEQESKKKADPTFVKAVALQEKLTGHLGLVSGPESGRGYGIPQPDEVDSWKKENQTTQEASAIAKELAELVAEIAAREAPAETARLRGSKSNQAVFSQSLSKNEPITKPGGIQP